MTGFRRAAKSIRRRTGRQASEAAGKGPAVLGSRERVLIAAEHLFSRKGFAATSVDEIAESAKASPSSIYWHFKGGKDDILLAVVEESTSGYVDRVLAEVQSGKSLDERFEIFLTSVERQMTTSPETLRVIHQLAMERSDEDGKVRQRLRAIYRRFRDAIVREMVHDFPQANPVIARQAATLMIALYDGLFFQWQLDPEEVDVKGLFRLLRLLRPDQVNSFKKRAS